MAANFRNPGQILIRNIFTGSHLCTPAGANATVSPSATAAAAAAPEATIICPFQVSSPSLGTATNNNAKAFSEIPSPKGLPIIGTYWEYAKNGGGKNLHTFSMKRHQELGPIFKEKTGVTHAVFIGDSETFRDVTINEGKVPRPFIPDPFELYMKTKSKQRGLFFMTGDEWTKNRRIMNNLLLKKQDHTFLYDHMEHVLNEHLTKWHHLSQRNGGLVPNIEMKMNEVVLATLASFLMGRTYDNYYSSNLSTDAYEFYANSKVQWDTIMKMQVIPAKYAQKFGLSVWKKYERSVNALLGMGNKWCDMVKADAESSGRDGFIHMTLKSVPEMKFEDLSRIMTDFILTSETETVMQTWLTYAMAQNPEAQDKVVEELKTVCGKGVQLKSCHLESTPYLRACVQEILRLYPATLFSTRILEKECVIGGYQIPPWTFVALNIYACQRDGKHFPDPEKFWPERWFRAKSHNVTSAEDASNDIWDAESPTSSNSTGREPYVGVKGSAAHPNMAFGWGWGATRSCIFRKVSLVRMHLFLGKLLQEFHLRCDPVTPTMRSLLVPNKDMNLRIAKRP